MFRGTCVQRAFPTRRSSDLRETGVEKVFTRSELLALQALLRAVPVADSALDWVVRLIEASHHHPLLRLGASPRGAQALTLDRKSTRLNSSHVASSYAVFCLT